MNYTPPYTTPPYAPLPPYPPSLSPPVWGRKMGDGHVDKIFPGIFSLSLKWYCYMLKKFSKNF